MSQDWGRGLGDEFTEMDKIYIMSGLTVTVMNLGFFKLWKVIAEF